MQIADCFMSSTSTEILSVIEISPKLLNNNLASIFFFFVVGNATSDGFSGCSQIQRDNFMIQLLIQFYLKMHEICRGGLFRNCVIKICFSFLGKWKRFFKKYFQNWCFEPNFWQKKTTDSQRKEKNRVVPQIPYNLINNSFIKKMENVFQIQIASIVIPQIFFIYI